MRSLICMMMGTVLAAVSATSVFAASPAAGSSTAITTGSGSTSASEQTCRACHSIDTTKVGPPFKAIAERYRGDTDAVAKLKKSMLEGSAGKWNTGAQMPPNAISAADAERFAHWIMSLK